MFLAVVCYAFIHFFFFNDTATTEIYTLSLHDALPIRFRGSVQRIVAAHLLVIRHHGSRSEEHTSELQSQFHLVCRLLLEKKKILNSAMLIAEDQTIDRIDIRTTDPT